MKRYIYGLFSQTTDGSAVTNTVTETTIIGSGQGGLTVPANGFILGDSFHAKLGGEISAQNGDEITMQIKNGATVLATTGVITLSPCTNQGWEIEIDFTVSSLGASGSINTNGDFIYSRDSGTFEGVVFNDTETTDTTASSTLDVTVTWGQAKTQDSISCHSFILTKTF